MRPEPLDMVSENRCSEHQDQIVVPEARNDLLAGAGGEIAAAADGALPRAPRRGALLLRPDHRHRHAARGLLCERDDGVSFCAADPGLRLSAICRTAS